MNIKSTSQQEKPIFGTKEYLKEKLKDQETIYVSYLNSTYTKMMFWYIDQEDNTLQKTWISVTKNDDKPSNWKISKIDHLWAYCFYSNNHDSYSALESLYYWLGYTSDDIYKNHKMPRIERLN